MRIAFFTCLNNLLFNSNKHKNTQKIKPTNLADLYKGWHSCRKLKAHCWRKHCNKKNCINASISLLHYVLAHAQGVINRALCSTITKINAIQCKNKNTSRQF